MQKHGFIILSNFCLKKKVWFITFIKTYSCWGFSLLSQCKRTHDLLLRFIIHKTKKILVLSSLCFIQLIIYPIQYQDFHMGFFFFVMFGFLSRPSIWIGYSTQYWLRKLYSHALCSGNHCPPRARRFWVQAFCRIRGFLCEVLCVLLVPARMFPNSSYFSPWLKSCNPDR